MTPPEIEELYRDHARRLAGYLMRATSDAEVAADLTAETFAAALVARDRYRPELGAPTTWLYGIAAHKLRRGPGAAAARDRAAGAERRGRG
jgi:DNA-directed RNA polymerase specialized sigma24 family protein